MGLLSKQKKKLLPRKRKKKDAKYFISIRIPLVFLFSAHISQVKKRERKKGAQNIHITCYKLKSLTAVD